MLSTIHQAAVQPEWHLRPLALTALFGLVDAFSVFKLTRTAAHLESLGLTILEWSSEKTKGDPSE